MALYKKHQILLCKDEKGEGLAETAMPDRTCKILYTIGHSNTGLEPFIERLRQHGIEVVADVRSRPYSGYTPHFSKEALQASLIEAGFKYVFLGRELGGQPEDESFYDEKGRVLYGKIAETEAFKGGLTRLMSGLERWRVAIMCGEEDPSGCHRRLLITRVLADQGVEVLHIRGDGRIEAEAKLRAAEAAQAQQLTLFDDDPALTEKPPWRSTQSVLRKNPPPNSSGSSDEPEYEG